MSHLANLRALPSPSLPPPKEPLIQQAFHVQSCTLRGKGSLVGKWVSRKSRTPQSELCLFSYPPHKRVTLLGSFFASVVQHVFWLTQAFQCCMLVCLRWCTLRIVWCTDEPKQIAFSSVGFPSNFQRTWFHTCLRRFWQTDERRTRRCCKSHIFASKMHVFKVFNNPSVCI